MPLIRNGCLNVTVSRRDRVKSTTFELARACAIQRKLNRFHALSPAFVANRRFAASEHSPASDERRTAITVRLSGQNSHVFLFRPPCAPFVLRSGRPDRYSLASRDG